MARQITVEEAISNTYLLATGKAGGLDIASTKGVKILALLNFYTKVWARDDWKDLYFQFTVTPLVTATDTFSLADLTTLDHVSQQEGDFVRIYHSDGSGETDYSIVPIDQLYQGESIRRSAGSRRCAQKGSSLVFDRVFTADDPQLGGTIMVPGYKIPTVLTTEGQVIQVSDPDWLSTRAAAQFSFTDVTRVQQYEPLLAEAAVLWRKMKNAELTQVETVQGGWAPFTGNDE